MNGGEIAAAHLDATFERQHLAATELAGLRDLILTFQRQGAVQDRLGAWLATEPPRWSAERQVWLLDTLSQTSLAAWPASWVAGLERALASPSALVQAQAVRTVATLQLAQLEDQIVRLGADPTVAAPLRLDALRALVPRRPQLGKGEFDFLLSQLNPQADLPAQLAAGQVVGKAALSEDQLPPLLQALRANTLLSPATVLPALLKVEGDRMEQVYAYLAEAVRNGWRPTEAEWAKITARLSPPLRPYADSLAAFLQHQRQGEARRLAQFEPLLTGGDSFRGRGVFFSPKAACGACHRVGSEGGRIGPDLTKIGAVRSGRDLLESILLPSSTFAQGYETWAVTTSDGRELDGVIARQNSDAIVLRDASGAETLLLRDQIKHLERRAASLMPEGLEHAMTREELQDLLAFLQDLK